MSRVAKNPVSLQSGVEATVTSRLVTIKGPKGSLEQILPSAIDVTFADGHLSVSANEADAETHALTGTVRALLQNMVTGVVSGFEKKLLLVGVGYRAEVKDKHLGLTLGFSHPVNYPIPIGIEIFTPKPTEIIIQGIDKRQVGQVAAKIRAYRPPEPYKGKGVRYADEVIHLKEGKKK